MIFLEENKMQSLISKPRLPKNTLSDGQWIKFRQAADKRKSTTNEYRAKIKDGRWRIIDVINANYIYPR